MTAPRPEAPLTALEEPDSDGKGLSQLQRRILVMALTNRTKEGRTDETRGGADLYYSEILAQVYGFPCECLYRKRSGELTDERSVGGKKFDRQAIGTDRYNRAQAAISRTMRRPRPKSLPPLATICATCPPRWRRRWWRAAAPWFTTPTGR